MASSSGRALDAQRRPASQTQCSDDDPTINQLFYEDDLSTSRNTKQIRLLVLLPGRWTDPIACDLWTSVLDVPYSALSYVWGSFQNSRRISLNGKAGFVVTRNLYAALRRLRQHGVFSIWVDAICINQANNAEKSAQVGMMGDIYRSAEKVWVYLGSCAGGEEENCRKHERFTDRIGAAFDAAIDFCLDQKGELSQNRQRYDYWWKRVWTMQEAVLAADISLLIGNHVLSWAEFLVTFLEWQQDDIDLEGAIFNLLTGRGRNEKHAYLTMWFEFTKIDAHRKLQRDGNARGLQLHVLIALLSSREATNPKDKVYSALGMVPDTNRHSRLIPDYEADDFHVCREATQFVIKDSKCLDIIVDEWPPFNEGLSSWVVNLVGVREERGSLLHPNRYESARDSIVRSSSLENTYRPKYNTKEDLGPHPLHDTAKDLPFNSFAAATSLEPNVSFLQGLLITQAVLFDTVLTRSRLMGDDVGRHTLYGPFADAATREISEPALTMSISAEEASKIVETFSPNRPINTSTKMKRFFTEEVATWASIKGGKFSERFNHVPEWQYALGLFKELDIFITTRGHIGVTKASSQVGDVVIVPFGATIPFLLRPIAGTQTFRLLGSAVVPGIMFGEAIGFADCGLLPVAEFAIF